MNLDWYYTFLVLAKHLNYHKASEELFLTEPTLHQQIKKLEKHLQVSLFETIGKKLTLTSTGISFIPMAKEIISTYEKNVEQIKLKDKNLETNLNIAVSPYIATYLLPKFLPKFFNQYPSINVSISILNNQIAHNIENNTFDIGIDRVEPYSNKIIYEQICEGKIALFYPKNANGLSEEELYQQYKIFSDNHPLYWDSIKEEVSSIIPEAQFTSIQDIAVTEKLIELGQGISYLPLYLKNDFSDQINYKLSEMITTPVSFTYLMNHKNTKSINTFKNEFKKFILLEQNKISI